MKISEISQIPEGEYVTCQRIVEFCKNNGIPYIKPDPIKYRFTGQIVSNSGWQNDWNVYDLYNMSIIVTGYSDFPIGSRETDIINNPNTKVWFANNIDMRHPKLVAMPLGLPNEVDFPIYGNTRTLYSVAQMPQKFKNLAYMNFKIETCPSSRQPVFNIFGDKDWVTIGIPDLTETGHRKYLEEIKSHKFCICPRGNGVDTHRMWECLYLGCIPICERSVTLEQFSDLPILFVDSWDEVTPEFLEKKYIEFSERDWNVEKLYKSFWEFQIKNYI